MLWKLFLDACFRRHDVIPAKAGIQNLPKNIEDPNFISQPI